MAVVTRCLDHQWNHDACCKQQAIISTFVASTEASHRAFNLTASQGDKEISYNVLSVQRQIPFKLDQPLIPYSLLLPVCMSSGNAHYLFWRREASPPASPGAALQFYNAGLDLLANLQPACHKLAANLINLITNMVFLKITSQSGHVAGC